MTKQSRITMPSANWLKKPETPNPCPVCNSDMGYRPDFTIQQVVPVTVCEKCRERESDSADNQLSSQHFIEKVTG